VCKPMPGTTRTRCGEGNAGWKGGGGGGSVCGVLLDSAEPQHDVAFLLRDQTRRVCAPRCNTNDTIFIALGLRFSLTAHPGTLDARPHCRARTHVDTHTARTWSALRSPTPRQAPACEHHALPLRDAAAPFFLFVPEIRRQTQQAPQGPRANTFRGPPRAARKGKGARAGFSPRTRARGAPAGSGKGGKGRCVCGGRVRVCESGEGRVGAPCARASRPFAK